MRRIRKHWLFQVMATLLAVLSVNAGTPVAWAASHREAPLIALDPPADITDVYAFRSWEDPGKAVFILNVIPGQEPSSGPNYFNFDDDVLYAINIDTNGDGKAEDIVYEVRFTTEIRGVVNDLGLPVSYAAVPPITRLDGPGSEGLGLRQRYTVTEVRGRHRKSLGTGDMFAVPSNVGPRTTPRYEELAAQGIYPLSNGGRVFAGQRAETFYIDLGAVFDTVNLRCTPLPCTPILTAADDADDTRDPFGVNAFSGFNVSSIAIEVPIQELTNNPSATIGVYASTSRQKVRVLKADGDSTESGKFQQVARMGNPLVNELIIGTGSKDFWNATEPEAEAQFLDFYLNSRLATVLNILFGTSFPMTGRNDLVAALLKYSGQDPGACSRRNPCAELLRLSLGVPPTAPAAQKRLGPLAHDAAGNPTPDPAAWPNGRRPNDDVTDIALRVVAGALLGPVPNLGDGVNFNNNAPGSNVTANGITTKFPFLPTPNDGRNRRHIDCGETGANPCN
ncbi:MAG TPA: DUF4331 domain-containing protein [Candidatus Methylomirabilis sp.]|nr:DUF4331 domain-containing protein [Candidatus Methylomirabilis sp.]